jgi:transposase
VSSDEIESEIASGPLPDVPGREQQSSKPTEKQRRARQFHPGRKALPMHLPRVEEIVACAPDECRCSKCGGETKVIAYEATEVLGKKPVEYYVKVIKREKRACTSCVAQGVTTASAPERIAPKSIFSDEVIIDFVVNKYCNSLPLFRQQAMLWRDAGLDVP